MAARKGENKPKQKRPLLLQLASVFAVAIFLAFVLSVFLSEEREISKLQSAIARAVSQQTQPDVAELLLEASVLAEELFELFPDNAVTFSIVAQLYDHLEQTEDAVRCYQKSMNLDPKLAPACHESIAAMAAKQGDQAAAAANYRAAMELNPNASSYPVQLGEALINQGEFQEAVAILERNLKARPNSMPTLVLLGQTHLQLRDYKAARNRFERAIVFGPNYTNAYYGLSTACARLGDLEKSKEYLSKFKILQAKDEQRHRDQLKTTKNSAVLQGTVAKIFLAAAKLHLSQGSVQKGETLLKRCLELDPNGVESRSVLAWLYEKQGLNQQALEILAELNEKAADDLSAQMNLASSYSRLGRFDEAEKSFQRAIALTPRQAGGYAAIARFYLLQERKLDEAKKRALQAIEIEPTADHFFLLSQICLKANERKEAITAVRKAVALDANNATYGRFLNVILENK